MGASKKLAASKEEKQALADLRQAKLDGIFAVGGSVASIFAKSIPAEELEDCAAELMALLNQIEATKPIAEFREVVLGAMRAIGFEPVK
jgi:hypothetical protein